jgi:YidC/Oxa1 family membrane protein insertase
LAEYQNPQQEPGSEKRLLLIFLVTFVIMLAFQPLLKKFLPTPPPPQQQPAQSVPAQPAAPPATATSTKAPAVSPSAGATKQAAGETETVLENDLYRITFTNRGAQVKSWILKKFDNEAENGRLDLVNPAAASQFGYPLSLWTYDSDLRGKLNSALYVASHDGQQSTPATVTFEYGDQDLSVRKTFSFDNTYIVKVDTSVTYKGNWVAALPAWPAGFGDQVTPAFYNAATIDYQFNKNIERLAIKKISGGGTVPGPFHWAGPSDLYFAAVFIPDDPASAAMVTLRNSLSVARAGSRGVTSGSSHRNSRTGNTHSLPKKPLLRKSHAL